MGGLKKAESQSGASNTLSRLSSGAWDLIAIASSGANVSA